MYLDSITQFSILFQSPSDEMTILAISKRGYNPDEFSGVTHNDLLQVYDNDGTPIQDEYYSCMEVTCPDENDQPYITIQPELPSGISCTFE